MHLLLLGVVLIVLAADEQRVAPIGVLAVSAATAPAEGKIEHSQTHLQRKQTA
jgi:hypothetical protein